MINVHDYILLPSLFILNFYFYLQLGESDRKFCGCKCEGRFTVMPVDDYCLIGENGLKIGRGYFNSEGGKE
jgi:hypothetical protein